VAAGGDDDVLAGHSLGYGLSGLEDLQAGVLLRRLVQCRRESGAPDAQPRPFGKVSGGGPAVGGMESDAGEGKSSVFLQVAGDAKLVEVADTNWHDAFTAGFVNRKVVLFV
jgi:hypothetical protein